MAQPLRKIRQRIAPAVPRGGFSFTLPPLAAAAVCVVMLACTGWAFFMGYMVGHGQNPGEEMRELTGIGLKEAKELVDGAPKPLKEGISKEECEKIVATFKEVGATVEVK